MLLQSVQGAGGGITPRESVALIGAKNGANSTFTTPDKFMFDADRKIKPIWNGRRLSYPNDFTVFESGGVGTGYDTVRLTPWQSVGYLPQAGHELIADYWKDPTA
jgi:hypothetical protein